METSGLRSIKLIFYFLGLTCFIFQLSALNCWGTEKPDTLKSPNEVQNATENFEKTVSITPLESDSDKQSIGKVQDQTIDSASKSQQKKNYLLLKPLNNENLLKLKRELIIYGNKHFPLFFRNFYIRVIEKTYNYPIVLLFILLILVFILNIFLVLAVLYYSNQQKNRKERYNNIYRDLYEHVLRSYIFGEIDWQRTLLKLKRLKNPTNRKILTEVLSNFQENLRGEMDSRIPEIYFQLGLHQDSLSLTKSNFYFNKVKGMRELTNLYPEYATEVIPNYINHSHDLVRAEAQISYIRLHPDHPFDFFKNLTTPFTRWTQLTAFHLFRLHQLPIPSFVDYLDSSNKNVRDFSLRMIIFYQQLENTDELLKLLDDQSEQTRFLCIKAINDLRLFRGKELIKSRYPGETDKNRLEIIKAIKNIGNAEDFIFLETIIRSGSITEKTEACRSLYYLNSEGKEHLDYLNRDADLNIEQYLAHISDLRN